MCRFPSKLSDHCCDFISMALEKNPLERPSIVEMLTHPWMKVGRGSGVPSSAAVLRNENHDIHLGLCSAVCVCMHKSVCVCVCVCVFICRLVWTCVWYPPS